MEAPLEEIRAAVQRLVGTNDNKALRKWLIEHWPLVQDERLDAVVEGMSSLSPDRAVRITKMLSRARERGLAATVLELAPLTPRLTSAIDQYLAADTWSAWLFLLRQYQPLLTSIDAEAYLAAIEAESSSELDRDRRILALVVRDKGTAFARQWAIAQLEKRSQEATLPMFVMHYLRELLFVPLAERFWDPLTEPLWAERLWRYKKAICTWGDAHDLDERGIRFLQDLQQSAEWAPNSVFEIKLVIAELYLVRPPGPNSDRAHNIELALSHGLQALEGIDRGYVISSHAGSRVHELLGCVYALRFQQDASESLERVLYHFSKALADHDAVTTPNARSSTSRVIAWSMRTIANRCFDAEPRRRAISYAVETLRRIADAEPDDTADIDLAGCLALGGEFEPNSLREATLIIERVLERTANDMPPAVRLVPPAVHEQHVNAVRRWAHARYVYAEIAARRRAREPEFDVSRAIEEIGNAEAYLSWNITAERPSGPELRGDLLMHEQKWQEALAAYDRAFRTPYPSVSVRYDPFTVHGQDAMATGASRVDFKVAYCLCRLDDPIAAVLQSDRSKTQAILDALRWESLLAGMQDDDRRDEAARALSEVRALERRARIAIHTAGEYPDTETGYLLIGARANLARIAERDSVSEAMLPFGLSRQDMLGVIPRDGSLVVPLVTPIGSAFVVLRRQEQPDPIVTVTYTPFTTEDCRDLLSRYLQLLEIFARPRPGEDPVRILEELLDELSCGLTRDLRQALVAAGTTNDASVTIVSQMGIGVLPLHACTGEPASRLLYEDYAYSSVPSVGVVAYQLQRAPAARTSRAISDTLIVANPTSDLPYAPLEGQLVAGAIPVPSRIVVGPEATKNRVATLSKGANLHFAGHAKADLSAPWRSFLRMADGELTAAEITGGEFAGPVLVTMSACETSFTDVKRAPHEFGGLATAFLMSGARSIVSSLWPMRDIPTALLMGEFYRVIYEDGVLDIPRALRCAELWLRSAPKSALLAWIAVQAHKRPLTKPRNWVGRWKLLGIRFKLSWWRGHGPPYGHPYYWAGFVALTVNARP